MAPGYIIVWYPPASCGRHICTEFNPSTAKVIPWYLRPDAPVIYTGPSLIWRLGRGSICYTYNLHPNKSLLSLVFSILGPLRCDGVSPVQQAYSGKIASETKLILFLHSPAWIALKLWKYIYRFKSNVWSRVSFCNAKNFSNVINSI